MKCSPHDPAFQTPPQKSQWDGLTKLEYFVAACLMSGRKPEQALEDALQAIELLRLHVEE